MNYASAATVVLLSLALAGCGSASQPTTIEGVWSVDVDRTLVEIKSPPAELAGRFADVSAYRQWLRPKIESLRFEFSGDGKVNVKRDQPANNSGTWERRADGVIVVKEPYIFRHSFFHHVHLEANGRAVCQYTVDYSESSAPRSPVLLVKQR